jgi:hypothetical protein
MEKLLRWLGIKLLVRSCLRRAPDWHEDRRIYEIVNRGAIYIALVGQKPGISYTAGGKRCLVLMGECIQYLVGRTVLRTYGSFFRSDSGIITVRPGPGVSWCWWLQFGRR